MSEEANVSPYELLKDSIEDPVDLAVYFSNGSYERIRSDRLAVLCDISSPYELHWMVARMRDGFVFVNPDNICIIRKWNHGTGDD